VLEKLKETLARTRKLFAPIEQLLTRNLSQEEILNELFELLILADLGPATSQKIIDGLKQKSRKSGQADLRSLLKQELIDILSSEPVTVNEAFPAVWLLVGVNGGGKTTSAAKLAHRYQSQGKKVMLAAADTFRAAARGATSLWAKG